MPAKTDTSNQQAGEKMHNKFASFVMTKSLKDNMAVMKKIFEKDDTLIITDLMNQSSSINCSIAYVNGMANSQMIRESIIEPILLYNSAISDYEDPTHILQYVIMTSEKKSTSDFSTIANDVISGSTALFVEGSDEVIIINTIGWKTRAIEEPESERILRGPREGFTESLSMNLTLIRRKLSTSDLKFQYWKVGTRSCTKICICYLEGVANPKIIEELYKRLDAIEIDGVIGSNYLQEYIKDAPLSPLKTAGSTERPDIIAAKLLEGRVAIVVDGTPVVLTIPHIFIEHFQSNEDYYINFYFSSINRILRILAFIIALSAPSIYLALVTFHQELIPTPLAISFAAAKEGIPFPTTIEALALLTIFEILRETGTRMPSYVGQALSIVGALVIGQAAVEARFVSAPIVIVIALSGITGLMVPKLKGVVIIFRTIFLLLSSVLGFYGFIFGMAGLLLHLFELRSFGVPYMLGLMTIDSQDIKDTIIRAPWWYMKLRPKFMGINPKRSGSGAGSK